MNFQQNPPGMVEQNQDLAYDLRQSYAKIVGDHLLDIAQARKADNYLVYYKALKDLFIIVKHKFKDKKIVDPETKEETTELKLYYEMIKKAARLANQHRQEWLGENKDPEACCAIEEALNDMEMFLYKKIDDAKMFGSSGTTPGL